MTTVVPDAAPATAGSASKASALLPEPEPWRLIDAEGTLVGNARDLPSDGVLTQLYRQMVIGRRFDLQATALTKQGRLAVYPSSRGQDACEVGSALALRDQDWLFPTYRDSVAIVARGVDPLEVLALLRQGLSGARRYSRLEEIHGEFLAIDTALNALEPGDLCLVLIDQVEEALAYIGQRTKAAAIA